MNVTLDSKKTVQGRVAFVYKNFWGEWEYTVRNVSMSPAKTLVRKEEYSQQLAAYYASFRVPLASPTDSRAVMSMLHFFIMMEAAKLAGCNFELRAAHIVSMLGSGDYIFDFGSRTGTYSTVQPDEFDAFVKGVPRKIRRRKKPTEITPLQIQDMLVQVAFFYQRPDGENMLSESGTLPDKPDGSTNELSLVDAYKLSESDLRTQVVDTRVAFLETDYEDRHSVCLLDGEMSRCNDIIFQLYGYGFYIIDYTAQSPMPIKVTEMDYKARIAEFDSPPTS